MQSVKSNRILVACAAAAAALVTWGGLSPVGAAAEARLLPETATAEDYQREIKRLQRQVEQLTAAAEHHAGEAARLQGRLRAQEARVSSLEEAESGCWRQLRKVSGTSKGKLAAQLEQMEKTQAAREEAAHYKGMWHVLDSLEIRGVPRTEEGLVFDKHFLTFEVRLNGKPLESNEFQTDKRESSVFKVASSVVEFAAMKELLPM